MKTIQNDREQGTVVLTNEAGEVTDVKSLPAIILSDEEAALLRKYKKFLLKFGLMESLHCRECWSGDLHDGVQAHVTDSEIVIRCRHQQLFKRGYTF